MNGPWKKSCKIAHAFSQNYSLYQEIGEEQKTPIDKFEAISTIIY